MAPRPRRRSPLERTPEHPARYSRPERLHRHGLPPQGSRSNDIGSRLTEHSPTGDFVARLANELRIRLADLDQERLAITKALRALEPASPREPPWKLDQALLERLRTSPRSRASMLALEF